MRGRLGSFQKETLQSTINSLKVAYENTAAAESAIRDADFASETSSMTRAQILIQSLDQRTADGQPGPAERLEPAAVTISKPVGRGGLGPQ